MPIKLSKFKLTRGAGGSLKLRIFCREALVSNRSIRHKVNEHSVIVASDTRWNSKAAVATNPVVRKDSVTVVHVSGVVQAVAVRLQLKAGESRT